MYQWYFLCRSVAKTKRTERYRFRSLLISHFLLDLRSIDSTSADGSISTLPMPSFVDQMPNQGSIIFANNILGNIGASLRMGSDSELREQDSVSGHDDSTGVGVLPVDEKAGTPDIHAMPKDDSLSHDGEAREDNLAVVMEVPRSLVSSENPNSAITTSLHLQHSESIV